MLPLGVTLELLEGLALDERIAVRLGDSWELLLELTEGNAVWVVEELALALT